MCCQCWNRFLLVAHYLHFRVIYVQLDAFLTILFCFAQSNIMTDVWFYGPVADAVKTVTQKNLVFLVFVYGESFWHCKSASSRSKVRYAPIR